MILLLNASLILYRFVSWIRESQFAGMYRTPPIVTAGWGSVCMHYSYWVILIQRSELISKIIDIKSTEYFKTKLIPQFKVFIYIYIAFSSTRWIERVLRRL